MCQNKNRCECQNEKQTEAILLSDQEMSEVKGGNIWAVLGGLASLIAVADAAGELGGYLGTKYGESVTDTSGGTISTPSRSTGYWQCNQSPCICGACGQSGGGPVNW